MRDGRSVVRGAVVVILMRRRVRMAASLVLS
jgi:hypothetical protein